MTFNVNSFRASFLAGEPARNNFFDVHVLSAPSPAWAAFEQADKTVLQRVQKIVNANIGSSPDTNGKGGDASNIRRLSFRCDEAELPGKQLSTTEHKYYGAMRQVAYGNTYTDVELSFICAEDMIERYFFDVWMKYIKDDRQINGSITTGPDGEPDDTRIAEGVRYHKDYIGEIVINQYDRDNTLRYKTTLREAYPISIQSMPVSWSTKDDIHRVKVSIAYTEWESEAIAPENTAGATAIRTIL